MPREVPEDVKKTVRKMLQKCDLKNPAWEEELYRLFTLTPTPEEKNAWIKMGVWKRGKVHMGREEMADLPLTFALWHLTRLGMLNRRVATDPK
jgi:hypothetical protein